MKQIYIFRLPDNHPTDPGRYEVDFINGPSTQQGGVKQDVGPWNFSEEGITVATAIAKRLEYIEKGLIKTGCDKEETS